MDRDEALKLLQAGREGVEEWNRRRMAGEAMPDLSETDLSGAHLATADLGAFLERAAPPGTDLLAQFVGADLSGGRLAGADLAGADLSGADLSGAKLIKASLRAADLSRAKLIKASLEGAHLQWATLKGASLGGALLAGAELYEASLEGAHLAGAHLAGARLAGADLTGAHFGGADLARAELDGARCSRTIFASVDLSAVRGLDSIVHLGPSTIGTDTLLDSKGKIPEAFLRGCGMPDSLISYLPSLIGSMSPIQFYSCFISHSSKDQGFADRLHSRMVQAKLRVWYAPEDMQGGRKSIDQIDEAIRVHDKVLLVLSKASMASDWAAHEIRRAVEREKRDKRQVLFPIGLASMKDIRAWTAIDTDTGRDLAKVVREYHIPSFSKWKDHDSFEASFTRLLDDLRASGERAVSPPGTAPVSGDG